MKIEPNVYIFSMENLPKTLGKDYPRRIVDDETCEIQYVCTRQGLRAIKSVIQHVLNEDKSTIEIDLEDWDKKDLIRLITLAADEYLTIHEAIEQILEEHIKNE